MTDALNVINYVKGVLRIIFKKLFLLKKLDILYKNLFEKT